MSEFTKLIIYLSMIVGLLINKNLALIYSPLFFLGVILYSFFPEFMELVFKFVDNFITKIFWGLVLIIVLYSISYFLLKSSIISIIIVILVLRLIF